MSKRMSGLSLYADVRSHDSWGYRLLFNYIRRLGETLNHKKFLRIYREKHLQIGKRSRRKERRFDRVKSGNPLAFVRRLRACLRCGFGGLKAGDTIAFAK